MGILRAGAIALREGFLALVRLKVLAVVLAVGAAGVATALSLRPKEPESLDLDPVADAPPVLEVVAERPPEPLAAAGLVASERLRRRMERAVL